MGKEIYNGNANENVMPLKYSELHIHLTNLGEQKRHIWKVLTERPDMFAQICQMNVQF